MTETENKAGELVYVSAPFLDNDEEVMEHRRFRTAVHCAMLLADGALAFSPIIYNENLVNIFWQSGTEMDWEHFGLQMLRKSDRLVVLKLDGWHESLGVKREIAEAERLGLPIEHHAGI